MLTFTGHPGSGFENCDVTTQTLTRGSQYQTSFLPEMSNGAIYKVKVHATYKDFNPINFELNVKYLPNLDGRTKFVDLGTHIFIRSTTKMINQPYNFVLSNVIDSQDDDIDSYQLQLSNGLETYYALENQENQIKVDNPNVPILGESIVKASTEENAFLQSQRKFFNVPGASPNIEIPLVPKLLDGELAVVLTWTQGAKTHGNQADLQSLDLHVEFKASDTVMCNVDYTQRQCNGVKMTADSFITDNKMSTVQAIKFDKVGDFEYMVYASRSIQTV